MPHYTPVQRTGRMRIYAALILIVTLTVECVEYITMCRGPLAAQAMRSMTPFNPVIGSITVPVP